MNNERPELVKKILDATDSPPVASFESPEEFSDWLDGLTAPKANDLVVGVGYIVLALMTLAAFVYQGHALKVVQERLTDCMAEVTR